MTDENQEELYPFWCNDYRSLFLCPEVGHREGRQTDFNPRVVTNSWCR